MEYNKYKCSTNEHLEINAFIFCKDCKHYFCDECQNFHSKIFSNHDIIFLNEEEDDIFTGICYENDHLNKLEYFCKTHNKLCCAKCITKIKDENNGQHKDCDISSLKETKIEKEKKFKENYDNNDGIEKSLDDISNQIKIFQERNIKDKKDLITEIKKEFEILKNALNEREDHLLSDADELFKKSSFEEEIIEENEKLPLKIRKSFDSINDIKNKEIELNSEINYYLEFENNLNKIDELNKSINKYNSSQKEIIFEYNNDEILNLIKNFGNFKKENKNNIEQSDIINDFNFNANPLDNLINEEKDFDIIFENEKIEKNINKKESKFFTIENIKIINIGQLSFQNLCFVKDKDNSSEDLNFFSNSKIIYNHELTMKEKLRPNDMDSFDIILSIKNPKPGKTYKMMIYVREKDKDKNLSKSLEIIIKLNKNNSNEELVNKLYNELEEKYNISGLFCGEDNSKKIIRENNCDKDEIMKLINSSNGESDY
jgi:hypothetical protein